MTELKGQALKDRATELDIPGRSTMKAGELRAAIATAETLAEYAKVTDDYVKENNETFKQKVRSALHLDKSTITYKSGGRTLPLDEKQRTANYVRMNNGGPVRAGKQSRRIKHKQNLALKRAGVS